MQTARFFVYPHVASISNYFFVTYLTTVRYVIILRHMKGEITLKILEYIANSTIDSIDRLEAFLVAGYGASLHKMDFEYGQIKRARERREVGTKEINAPRHRAFQFIHCLKRDELIKESGIRGKSWTVTDRGIFKMRELQGRRKNYAKVDYPKEGGELLLVIFDIPESLRAKRNWLRCVLRNMGFSMIQKSVWAGKVKLPQEFIDDIKTQGLLPFIEVLAITKSGSLKQIF